MNKQRLEEFTNAVLVIICTLLILDVKGLNLAGKTISFNTLACTSTKSGNIEIQINDMIVSF